LLGTGASADAVMARLRTLCTNSSRSIGERLRRASRMDLTIANLHAQTLNVSHEGETFCFAAYLDVSVNQGFAMMVDAPAGPTNICVPRPATLPSLNEAKPQVDRAGAG
jgi:hypothetical protein